MITVQNAPTNSLQNLGNRIIRISLLNFGAFVLATSAYGQAAADRQVIEEVVVTGSARAKTIEKSTIAVTSLGQDELGKISTSPNPTQVLQSIPGITIELSGNSDFNLMSRGFPQNFSPAGNIYVQIREDGLPILENPLFVDAQYFSSGPGLARVEGVRGSTSGIWGTNSPGALVNFILKEGGDEFEGQANFTYGSQGMYNFQSNISGPLADFDDLYYSLSANYVYDEGIRDRQHWPLNEGGEIFGNIVKEFDRGRLKLSAKMKNITAHQTRPGIVSFSSDTGFSELPEYDIREDNFVVNDIDRYSIPLPGGGSQEREMSDGNTVDFYYVGAKLELDLSDNWTSTTQFRFTEGTVSTDIDINLFNQSVREYADGIRDEIGADTYRVEFLVGDGRVFSEAEVDEVGGNGLWAPGVHITWDWDNTNAFLQQQFDHVTDRNAFSGAVYLSHFTRDRRGQFHNLFHEARGNPRSLELIMERDGEDIPVTNQGFAQFSTNNRDEKSESLVAALVLEDEIFITDKLDLTGAFRYEFKDVTNNEARFAPVDLDGNPDTIYDNNYLAPTGEFVLLDDDFSETAWTLAANYQISPEFGVFLRYSDLFLSRTIQDYTEKDSVEDVTTPTQSIDMVEIGLKYYTANLSLFATLYYAELDGIPDNRFIQDPVTGEIETVTTFGGSESTGLELDAKYRFSDAFDIDLSVALLDADYVNTFVEGPDGVSIDVTGNQVIRQPDVNVRFQPTWYITEDLEAFVAGQFFSERTGNQSNTVTFDSYTMVNAGLTWYRDDWFIRGEIVNALDEAGQQEGSVQEGNLIGGNVENVITLGRFTPGISGQITVGLSF